MCCMLCIVKKKKATNICICVHAFSFFLSLLHFLFIDCNLSFITLLVFSSKDFELFLFLLIEDIPASPQLLQDLFIREFRPELSLELFSDVISEHLREDNIRTFVTLRRVGVFFLPFMCSPARPIIAAGRAVRLATVHDDAGYCSGVLVHHLRSWAHAHDARCRDLAGGAHHSVVVVMVVVPAGVVAVHERWLYLRRLLGLLRLLLRGHGLRLLVGLGDQGSCCSELLRREGGDDDCAGSGGVGESGGLGDGGCVLGLLHHVALLVLLGFLHVGLLLVVAEAAPHLAELLGDELRRGVLVLGLEAVLGDVAHADRELHEGGAGPLGGVGVLDLFVPVLVLLLTLESHGGALQRALLRHHPVVDRDHALGDRDHRGHHGYGGRRGHGGGVRAARRLRPARRRP